MINQNYSYMFMFMTFSSSAMHYCQIICWCVSHFVLTWSRQNQSWLLMSVSGIRWEITRKLCGKELFPGNRVWREVCSHLKLLRSEVCFPQSCARLFAQLRESLRRDTLRSVSLPPLPQSWLWGFLNTDGLESLKGTEMLVYKAQCQNQLKRNK